jgi:hypothetical protein
MSGCPYTWFKSLFQSTDSTAAGTQSDHSKASSLRVTVTRDSSKTVDVTLPARSARWLIDLIPADVITKIKNEGIPIEAIQDDLAASSELRPQKIFKLSEPHREVDVWLE